MIFPIKLFYLLNNSCMSAVNLICKSVYLPTNKFNTIYVMMIQNEQKYISEAMKFPQSVSQPFSFLVQNGGLTYTKEESNKNDWLHIFINKSLCLNILWQNPNPKRYKLKMYNLKQIIRLINFLLVFLLSYLFIVMFRLFFKFYDY